MAFRQPKVNRADKKSAEREGGQVLITESNAQGSSGLYDLPFSSEMNISPSVKKSSVGANNSLQKCVMHSMVGLKYATALQNNAVDRYCQRICGRTSVVKKNATPSILQEIIYMAKEDYQWSESRGVLYAISQPPAFSESIRKKR